MADELCVSARQRINLVYLTSTFEPDIGGTVRQVASQARALAAKGYCVTVLTKKTKPDLPTNEQRNGIQVVRLSYRPGRAGDLLYLLAAGLWLTTHKRRIGVVQAVLHPEFLIPAVPAGLLDRSALLWVGRGDATRTLAPKRTPLGSLLRALRRSFVRRTTNIVLTPEMAREIAPYAETAEIIPVPVDSSFFRPATKMERERARGQLGLDPSDTMLLFTGHLDPGKGVHNLIEALARLSRTGIKLYVVGGPRDPSSNYSQRLREQVSRLGLEANVVFHGYADDVRDPFLWAADAFVLPSEREGMPNSVLEAMACGLPALLPAIAAGDELLDPEFGIIPTDNTPEELVAALRILMNRQPEWETMGSLARQRAEDYSVSSVTRQYDLIYRMKAERGG